MHRAGWLIRSRLPELAAHNRPVIAILAASVEVGIMRANCIFFPISPRNSPSAVAHLLTATNALHLLTGPEPAFQDLASAAFDHMRATGEEPPVVSIMPSFDDIIKPTIESDFKFLPQYTFRLHETANIFHSSGSSAFPKPIPSWHYRYLVNGTNPFFGVEDLTGLRVGFHSLPMFHGWGGMLIAWTAACGVVLCTFPPKSPATVPTPENTLQAMTASESKVAFCVPSFIEVFGGGPLDKGVGDMLVDSGVVLTCAYGSTEAGVMHQLLPSRSLTLSPITETDSKTENMGKDWQYLNFDAANVRTHWIDQSDGTFELVILPSPFVLPSITNTKINGEAALATNDLFVPHPTRPGLWKIYGRTDDQIIHSTGEKTNPGPLEAMLNQDPCVERCVMFGRGHFYAGVLVEPKSEYQFGPSDIGELAAFRTRIWATVERMNEYAPQHSRIFKEMILVASPTKPFSYTAKNTPRRQAILREYDEEIEALYAAAAETTQADEIPSPSTWDETSTLTFVSLVVSQVVKSSPADTDDIFQTGCDSLQATWIRNSILHALRESSKVDVRSVPGNFVYQHPTIVGLARYVHSLAGPSTQSNGHTRGPSNTDEAIAAMLSMVEKYHVHLPKHAPTVPLPPRGTVLITGTTGSLGCTLLSRLLEDTDIEHIYALNRISEEGKELLGRQKDKLVEWGLDPEIVHSLRVTFLEADMSADKIGLSDDTYGKISKSITHIIHNAYRVNFNLALASFESNVKAARSLIDLALSSPHRSPPRLLFVSSIGVLGSHTGRDDGPVLEGPVEPLNAVSSGYTQSKWVIERLLSLAETESALRPIVVRLGQVTGGATGAWNRAEWFPAMVKSSSYIGCFPTMKNQRVSWVPASAVAKVILEMRDSPYPFLHLAHPRPVLWSTIITPIAESLNLPLKPYDEWLASLHRSGDHLDAQQEVDVMGDNPALRILGFFNQASVGQERGEVMDMREMDMSRAKEVAPTLGDLPQLSEADVESWLAYWRI
ncbi:hypothetical protein EUX98_g2485 [Antrodiella citrinella]|uniref:Carrier domain-containing protein n=1 Tax=Antrodiella citrinella TaxID=2447956 RepID=A0A4S4N1U7_9APHY|nr:hypothetical protein EUX98_g2485 [Antrodiella citrinella]